MLDFTFGGDIPRCFKMWKFEKRITKFSCNITEIYLQYNAHRFDRPANLYAADDKKKKKWSLRSSQMNSSKTFLGLKVTRYEYNE